MYLPSHPLLPLLPLFCLIMLSAANLTHGQVVQPEVEPLEEQNRYALDRRVMEERRINLDNARRELEVLEAEMPKRLENLDYQNVTQTMVAQARVDVDSVLLRQQNLALGISGVEQEIDQLEKVIRELEARELLLKNPAKDETEGFRRVEELERTSRLIAQRKSDLDLAKQTKADLAENLDLEDTRLALMVRWQRRVEELYRLRQEEERQRTQDERAREFQQQQRRLMEAVSLYTRQLERERDDLPETARQLLQAKIRTAQEQMDLLQSEQRLAAIEDDLNRLEELAARTDPKARELGAGLKYLRNLQDELENADALLKKKGALIRQRISVIARRDHLDGESQRLSQEELALFEALITEVEMRREQIAQALARAEALDVLLAQFYEKRLRQDLLVSRPLPTSIEEWQRLWEAIDSVPRIFLNQVLLSFESAFKTMFEANALTWALLAGLEFIVLWLILVVRRSLNRIIKRLQSPEESSFVGTAIRTVLRLLRKNLVGVGIAAAVLVAVLVFEVPQPGMGIILTLVLIWVGIKTPVNLAWLLLASPSLPPEKRRPGLYAQVKWTLVLGGIFGVLVILAHLSQVSDDIVSVFDRLFMLVLLIAFVPALRIRRLLMELLAQRYADRFWFSLLRLATLIMPLAMVAAAIIGLLGLLNLARLVAWYLLLFVAVMIGWQVVRALVEDLVVMLKNYAVKHSGYGLLWTQDVINPLHRILDIFIFLGASWMLFRLYDLGAQSFVVTKFIDIVEQPLFSLGGSRISLQNIIVTLVIVMIVLWFGQWGRSITYRWMFSRISDLGVRHSMSVFTQYFIVLVGFLITLNIVGLDLTTLAVFAGALGVGIGLGMQDMAKNFISGLLLLIERPLRSGDTVQIGTHVGEVTRIGIRSLTVKTWDSMEVIIPNADVISNAFTNWTHSDNMIRTVLMVGVRYDTDPHQVKAIIEGVLKQHRDVLADPEWMVLLWEFGETALTFRVQYFIDYSRANILEVRDQVDMGIWDGFKAAGIQLPYPQGHLHIKEWPPSFNLSRRQGPGEADSSPT